MAERTHSFTIKTTDFCNLACTYCYSPNATARNITDMSVIDRVIQRMTTDFDSDQLFYVVWHGSEPMAAGLAFFQEATTRFEGAVPGRVSHHMQTNLTLLDSQWVDFFKAKSISISTSVDGPKAMHDAHRVDFGGKGSFDRVVSAIKTLRDAKISCSAILVLTKEHLPHAKEISGFIRDQRIPVRINPVLLPQDHPDCLDSADYGRFTIELVDELLRATDGPIDIEPVRGMLFRLVSGVSTACEQGALCFRHMKGVGTDGKLYPCNRFVNVEGWSFGDASKQSIPDIHTSPRAQRVAERYIRSPKCQTCEVREICKGGCMFHSHVIYGDAFREDYFCESYIELWNYLTQNLARLLPRVSRMPGREHLERVSKLLAAESLTAHSEAGMGA